MTAMDLKRHKHQMKNAGHGDDCGATGDYSLRKKIKIKKMMGNREFPLNEAVKQL